MRLGPPPRSLRMKFLSLLLAVLGLTAAVQARPFIVVAYNVENLMDLDGITQFAEYQPARYSRAHMLTKLQNISRVVAQFEDGRGPDVIIFNEIEVDFSPAKTPLDVDAVLKRYSGVKIEEMLGAKFDREIADLPSEALLAKAMADRGLTGYRVVPAESVVTGGRSRLEQKNAVFTRFPVKGSRSHPTTDARAILEVQLDVDGALLHVFANHWKSGASDPATEETRAANAQTLRSRLNEIFAADPNADVVIGGDLNSQYNHKQRYPAMTRTGINDVLGSQGNERAVIAQERDLYNLWYELPVTERGSDTYRGEWGTLMHLILSRGLYDFRGVQYVDNSFAVGKFPTINADVKGLPVRWTFDGPGGAGYSDHYPVYAKFVTVPDDRADRWVTLRNPGVESPSAAVPQKIDLAQVNVEKVALTAAQLPAGTNLRTDAYKGKIFRVEGQIAPGTRLGVEFMGETYDIYSYDAALRTKLRADFKAGATVKFYGELGVYRERWQFIVQDPSWVK